MLKRRNHARTIDGHDKKYLAKKGHTHKADNKERDNGEKEVYHTISSHQCMGLDLFSDKIPDKSRQEKR